MLTGSEIRREVGRRLNALRAQAQSPLAPAYVQVLVTQVDTLNTVVDSERLRSDAYTPQAFQNYFVRVPVVRSYPYPPEGDKVRATILDPSTGTLSVSPGFSAIFQVNDEVELWHPDIDPDAVDAARDRALSSRCTRWRRVPLTLLPDGDMLKAGTSAWQGSAAYIFKVALGDADAFQEQALQVSTQIAGGGAYQSLSVRPKERWTLAALVRAEWGTARLAVWDVTGDQDVALQGRTEWDGQAFQLLRATFETPEGCEQIQVRLTGAEPGALSLWLWVVAYPADQTVFLLPSRAVSYAQVGGLYELRGDDWAEVTFLPLPRPEVEEAGSPQLLLVLPSAPGDRLLFWGEYAYYSPLQTSYWEPVARRAGDAATTACPLEYVVAATLEELYPGIFQKELRRQEALYGARRAVRWRRELKGVALA